MKGYAASATSIEKQLAIFLRFSLSIPMGTTKVIRSLNGVKLVLDATALKKMGYEHCYTKYFAHAILSRSDFFIHMDVNFNT